MLDFVQCTPKAKTRKRTPGGTPEERAKKAKGRKPVEPKTGTEVDTEVRDAPPGISALKFTPATDNDHSNRQPHNPTESPEGEDIEGGSDAVMDGWGTEDY